RTGQHTKNDAHQSRVRNISRPNVREQFRAIRNRRSGKLFFSDVGNQSIETPRVAKVLNQQRLKIFGRQLFEKCLESGRQDSARKSSRRDTSIQSKFSNRIIGSQ